MITSIRGKSGIRSEVRNDNLLSELVARDDSNSLCQHGSMFGSVEYDEGINRGDRLTTQCKRLVHTCGAAAAAVSSFSLRPNLVTPLAWPPVC